MSLPLAECNERLESEQKAINKELEDLKDSLENSSQQMDQLKTALYAKFGKAINLER